jgi:nicotinate-nucleotide--dimethylbenzimidazole phosphoribosyltransferase
MRLGEGTGALVALPLLRAAVRSCAEMVTLADAGIAPPGPLRRVTDSDAE